MWPFLIKTVSTDYIELMCKKLCYKILLGPSGIFWNEYILVRMYSNLKIINKLFIWIVLHTDEAAVQY